jgi:hypothetical protein
MSRKKAKIPITKAVLLLLLAALVFILVCTSDLYALSQTMVKLEPALCSASLGETFMANITVADVQNLYGLEVDVSWNASVLEIARVDVRVGQAGGALYSSVYIVENSTTDSQYTLAATSVAPAPPFNGTGTAATITFRVKDHGNSSLSVTSQLYDFPPPDRDPRVSLPIEHTTLGSTFEETIPEIGSLPLLAFLIVAVVSAAVLCLKKLGSPHGGRSRQKVINEEKANSVAGS